jgi:hypothetical protein
MVENTITLCGLDLDESEDAARIVVKLELPLELHAKGCAVVADLLKLAGVEQAGSGNLQLHRGGAL